MSLASFVTFVRNHEEEEENGAYQCSSGLPGRRPCRHSSSLVDDEEEEYDDEDGDEDEYEDGIEEVPVNHVAIKETTLLTLELENRRSTLTDMMNISPKKKKQILNLARRSKPKLLKYFQKHAFMATETLPDGSERHFMNKKLMKEFFSPYFSNEEDKGLEPFTPKTERRRMIYA